MKRLFIFIISIVLFGCSVQPPQKIELKGIEEIQYDQLIQNLNSNVKFIMYIGRPDCGDCQAFYPILQDYIETHENTGIYYLNVKSFRDKSKRENASQDEKDFYKSIQDQLHFDWTPTLHVIENGKFIKTYQYLDEDYFEIKDRIKQKERRQEFINEFNVFMDEYFKEDK